MRRYGMDVDTCVLSATDARFFAFAIDAAVDLCR